MGNRAKKDARTLELYERRRQVLEMRKAGATYDQIAKSLGLADGSNARRDFQAALLAVIEEPAKEVLALELSRLDTMVMGLWAKAKSGDVAAIDRVIRIMDRRAAYLGLDAPKRQEVTGANGGPIATVDIGSLTDEQLERVCTGDLSPLTGPSGEGTQKKD